MSGYSDEDCSEVYVPSTCATALPAATDTVLSAIGLTGRSEYFNYTATLTGYITVNTDLDENVDGVQFTDISIYSGDCESWVYIGGGTQSSGGQAVATVRVDVGVKYTIVFNNWSNPGAFVWELDEY